MKKFWSSPAHWARQRVAEPFLYYSELKGRGATVRFNMQAKSTVDVDKVKNLWKRQSKDHRI
ncbi:hypothetical protein [Alistipes putredinis]|uniref:hypothetical protein n=1 Tax=Alistipes putredinis TaxID=28117 RepID=UPI003AB7FEC5